MDKDVKENNSFTVLAQTSHVANQWFYISCPQCSGKILDMEQRTTNMHETTPDHGIQRRNRYRCLCS
ncbi:hypothetical protein MKW98_002212 [Papaver atlanticum]|uniref:Uncharacterized protein n=1 Tax=Papaver atlanticum TaxID=357466 RepID=A0AAD4X3V8_9MAGN|nr:hypothetical protein MKW98_002212 [Papaver atlanticum]